MLQSSPRPNRVDSRYHERVLYCAIIDVCNHVEIRVPSATTITTTLSRLFIRFSANEYVTREETRLISLSLSLSLCFFSDTYILRPRFFPFNHDENVRGIRISPTVNIRLGYFAISRGGPRRPVIISFKNPRPPVRRSTRENDRPTFSATNRRQIIMKTAAFARCVIYGMRAEGRGKKLRYAAGIRWRRRRRRRTMPFA